MTAPPPPERDDSIPPDPARYKRGLLPDMKDAPAGTRVAGFFLGSFVGLSLGLGLAIGGLILVWDAEWNPWIWIALAGPVYLTAAILVGRWLWKAKHMKGAAVGLILAAALWCALAVTCGVMIVSNS